MRFIDINALLEQIAKTEGGASILKRVRKAQKSVARMPAANRTGYLKRNGASKWTPVKDAFTALLGHKCWYTEVEVTGAPLTVDHFRPKTYYWFMAFDPTNFRIACAFANSPYHNPLYGRSGGKGDEFPLLGAFGPARDRSEICRERPLLLDPCNLDDCKLIVFEITGRPVVNPGFKLDPIAVERVEKSLLLLNIDHPDFNSKREQLFNDIKRDVKVYGELPEGSDLRAEIHREIVRRIQPKAAFSVSARQYLQGFRNHLWVEEILKAST